VDRRSGGRVRRLKLVVLTGDPPGPLLEDLLLPDGDYLLQPVNGLVAGQECFLTVR